MRVAARPRFRHAEMLRPGGPALGGARRTIIAGIVLLAVGVVLAPLGDESTVPSVSVLMLATLTTAALTDAPSGVLLGALAVAIDRVLLHQAGASWWPFADGWGDVAIMVSLLLTGTCSGVAAQHRRLLTLRATARWREVVVLRQWVTRRTGSARAEIDTAGHDIADLLGATGWEWHDSRESTTATDEMPVLHSDGTLSGRIADLGEDRRLLPTEYTMPARNDDGEVGCFRFRAGDQPISIEARVVAGAIVDRVAMDLVQNSHRPPDSEP